MHIARPRLPNALALTAFVLVARATVPAETRAASLSFR